MSVTPASPTDLPYIVHLSKIHAEELGFLTRSAMEAYLQKGRVTLARENGDPCGYFLVGGEHRQQRIFQACVQMDARGLAHGVDLLSGLVTRAAAAGVSRITLHCRDGLESNGFWSACGFRIGQLLPGGRARRKIVIEWELSIRDALANPSLPYASRFLDFLGSRPQTGKGSPPCSCTAGTPPHSSDSITAAAAATAAAATATATVAGSFLQQPHDRCCCRIGA